MPFTFTRALQSHHVVPTHLALWVLAVPMCRGSVCAQNPFVAGGWGPDRVPVC